MGQSPDNPGEPQSGYTNTVAPREEGTRAMGWGEARRDEAKEGKSARPMESHMESMTARNCAEKKETASVLNFTRNAKLKQKKTNVLFKPCFLFMSSKKLNRTQAHHNQN